MSTSAEIASRLLDQNRRALAESISIRLEKELTGQEGAQSAGSPESWNAAIEAHLQTLAACIYFASPRLLADYVRWGMRLSDANVLLVNEIETVLRLAEQVAHQEMPREAATVISDYLQSAREANQLEKRIFHATRVESTLQQHYLSALLARDRTEALRLTLEAVHSDLTVKDIYLDVIRPSQQEIGRLWQAGQITVADEHYCTAATQFIMSQLHSYFLQQRPCNKVLVASCVGDELHEVGLRMIADLFEMDGWDAVYLGANLPASSVTKSLLDSGANVLALSTTMTRNLFALADLVSAVRNDANCRDIKIMVGGYPFDVDPFLWRRVGADAGASDAEDAILTANHLLNEKAAPTSTAGLSKTPRSLSPAGRDVNDLSRLNNELITAQRQLSKANLHLRQLIEANEVKTKALEKADQRKNEFLAMLAHELRGPLAPMSHALAILRMENSDPSIITEARETIQRQVNHMAHLISDLLDASRIAHGKIELKKEQVELSSVIDRAVEIARPLIEKKSHQLIVDQSDVLLEGDKIRLTQVVANLLTNAAKYTEAGGTIWLRTKRMADQAIIEVRDDGIGITPDLLPEVFDTFTQEQRAKRHSSGGLGLGLKLVKQLVELHYGSVHATSQGEGKGSVFSVSLPALEPVRPVDDVDSSEQDSPDTTVSRRVLVVDDTAGIAKITSRLLQMLGHRTAIAFDGKSAVEEYRESRPEIVLLDLLLPDMSGFDVARAIRELDVDDQTLIVALTGRSDHEHRHTAAEAGFDEYLIKPADVREIKKLTMHPKFSKADGIHQEG